MILQTLGKIGEEYWEFFFGEVHGKKNAKLTNQVRYLYLVVFVMIDVIFLMIDIK